MNYIALIHFNCAGIRVYYSLILTYQDIMAVIGAE